METLVFVIACAVAVGLVVTALRKDAAEAMRKQEEQRAKWRKYSAAKRARRKASSGR